MAKGPLVSPLGEYIPVVVGWLVGWQSLFPDNRTKDLKDFWHGVRPLKMMNGDRAGFSRKIPVHAIMTETCIFWQFLNFL